MNTKLKAERLPVGIPWRVFRRGRLKTRRGVRRGNWKKEIFTPKLACLRKEFRPAVRVPREDNSSRTH